MYINDLPEVARAILYLFADETKLLKAVTSLQDSILLQNDINALEEWSKIWLFRFHPKKCHVLALRKVDNIRHVHPYQLGDTVLEHVFSEKDLGVIFDSDLSFEEHLLAQVRKANSMVGLRKRSFFHLSPSLFRQLYTIFVRPHLEYAQIVWSQKLRKHSKLLEGVQRRATRTVDTCKNHPYTRRLEDRNSNSGI